METLSNCSANLVTLIQSAVMWRCIWTNIALNLILRNKYLVVALAVQSSACCSRFTFDWFTLLFIVASFTFLTFDVPLVTFRLMFEVSSCVSAALSMLCLSFHLTCSEGPWWSVTSAPHHCDLVSWKQLYWPTSAWLHNPIDSAGSPLEHQRHVCARWVYSDL